MKTQIYVAILVAIFTFGSASPAPEPELGYPHHGDVHLDGGVIHGHDEIHHGAGFHEGLSSDYSVPHHAHGFGHHGHEYGHQDHGYGHHGHGIGHHGDRYGLHGHGIAQHGHGYGHQGIAIGFAHSNIGAPIVYAHDGGFEDKGGHGPVLGGFSGPGIHNGGVVGGFGTKGLYDNEIIGLEGKGALGLGGKGLHNIGFGGKGVYSASIRGKEGLQKDGFAGFGGIAGGKGISAAYDPHNIGHGTGYHS